MPAGHESVFGDTLSMVLAGTVIAPNQQQSPPGITNLGALSLNPTHDVEAGLDIGELASLLVAGGQQIAPSPNGTVNDLQSNPTLTSELQVGSAVAPQKPSLPASLDAGIDNIVPSNNTASLPKVNAAPNQHINSQPFTEPTEENLAAARTLIAEKGTPTPTLSTTTPKAVDVLVPEQVRRQLSQASSAISEQRSVANKLSSSTAPHNHSLTAPYNQELQLEPPRTVAPHVNHAQASDQRLQPSIQQSTLVQQTSDPTAEILSQANHLIQKGQQVNQLHINKDPAVPNLKPVAAAAHHVSVTEIIGSDTSSSNEVFEIYGSEPGRLDTAGGASSKPQVQPAQSPNMQIAIQVARAIPQGVDRFTIHLHPMELGSVDVQLNFAEDGHVSALIVAERPETLDMLQRDSRALERSLANTGLQLENGSLSFSLKQEQGQSGQGFNNSTFQQSRTDIGDATHMSSSDHGPDQEVHVSRQRLLDIRT